MEIRFGGHLSAEDGLGSVVMTARALNYNIVQTMLGGGGDYNPYSFSEEACREYRQTSYGIKTYVHLPYIINPCESLKRKRGFYRSTVQKYIEASLNIGAKALVLHAGYKKKLEEAEAFTNLVEFMESLEDSLEIPILLEVDSGSKNGSAIGSMKFITDALDLLKAQDINVGLCIDTVHLYSRGENLWDPEYLKLFLATYGDRIDLVHLNAPDPNVVIGGHLDRHNIPFEERPDLDSEPMILTLLKRYPCILERRSVVVQETDSLYVRKLIENKEATK